MKRINGRVQSIGKRQSMFQSGTTQTPAGPAATRRHPDPPMHANDSPAWTRSAALKTRCGGDSRLIRARLTVLQKIDNFILPMPVFLPKADYYQHYNVNKFNTVTR